MQFYLSVWFCIERNSVWCQINRIRVIKILLLFDLTIFRKKILCLYCYTFELHLMMILEIEVFCVALISEVATIRHCIDEDQKSEIIVYSLDVGNYNKLTKKMLMINKHSKGQSLWIDIAYVYHGTIYSTIAYMRTVQYSFRNLVGICILFYLMWYRNAILDVYVNYTPVNLSKRQVSLGIMGA